MTNQTAGAPGCTSNVPSCTVEGLAEGVGYTFTVVAKIGAWDSPASAPFGARSGQTDAVTIVSTTPNPLALTDPSTVVTWRANVNGAYSVRIGGTSCATGTLVTPNGSGDYTTQPATVDTTILRTQLADGDNVVRVCVGSVSTTTTVTKTAPAADTTGPTNAFSVESPTGAYLSGTTLFYKSDAAGSFVLVNTMSDNESGPLSTTFPQMTTNKWTHALETVATPVGGPYRSSTYSWTQNAAVPTLAERTISGRDVATNKTDTVLTFTQDVTAPTGGAVTPTGATGTTVSVTITDPTDAGSGFKSATYSRERGTRNATTGACTSYGSRTTVTLTSGQDTIPARGACYRYRIATATDNVGNEFTVSGSNTGWAEISVAP